MRFVSRHMPGSAKPLPFRDPKKAYDRAYVLASQNSQAQEVGEPTTVADRRRIIDILTAEVDKMTELGAAGHWAYSKHRHSSLAIALYHEQRELIALESA